jgi:hypothetical protein
MSTGIVRPRQKSKGSITPSSSTPVHRHEDGRVDWLAAVEQIKLSLQLIEDKDVAMTLNVPVSTFSEFRNSAGNLPLLAKLRVLHLVGYESLTEALDLLTREESVEKNRRKLQRHARKTSQQTQPDN